MLDAASKPAPSSSGRCSRISIPWRPDFRPRSLSGPMRRLRAERGPYYFAAFDVWLLARFADVSAAALNPKLVRSLEAIATPQEIAAQKRAANWHDMKLHSRFVQFSLLDSDGPVHDRLRKLVMREFSPAAIARLKAQTQSLGGPAAGRGAGQGRDRFRGGFRCPRARPHHRPAARRAGRGLRCSARLVGKHRAVFRHRPQRCEEGAGGKRHIGVLRLPPGAGGGAAGGATG